MCRERRRRPLPPSYPLPSPSHSFLLPLPLRPPPPPPSLSLVEVLDPFEFDLKWATPLTAPKKLQVVPENLAIIAGTLRSTVRFETDEEV